jgi:hypothetical protein
MKRPHRESENTAERSTMPNRVIGVIAAIVVLVLLRHDETMCSNVISL